MTNQEEMAGGPAEDEPRSRPQAEAGSGGEPGPSAEAREGTPDPEAEEELRRRLEEELRKARIEDFMVQSISGILNLTARRLAKEDERDLAQARVGIDAIRAWLDLLPEATASQVKNALSELQMLYAQLVEGAPPQAGEPEPAAGGGDEPPGPGQARPGPSGARQGAQKPPSRLWTPPGTS